MADTVIASLSLILALAAAPPQADESRPALVLGRVIDADTGRPIAGAVVTPAGSAVVSAPPGAGPARVLTNASGHFVLRGLTKGSLVLTATRSGFVNATYGQRRPGGSTQPIPIDAGQWKTDVDLRMWKYAAIAGTILDEYGDPAVDLRVQAMRKTFIAGRPRFIEGPATTTDDRGMYRISGLTPGDYIVLVPSTQTAVPTDVMESFFTGTPIGETTRIELGRELNAIGSAIAPSGSAYAMKAGGQTFSLPSGTLTPIVTATGTLVYPTAYYPAAASAADATLVRLGSGQERGGIDLQMRPLRGVRVSGTLAGPEGPVPTTAVRLVAAGAGDAIEPLQVAQVATTITDWTGAFTFAAVPAGQYQLRVVRLPRPPADVDGARVSASPSGTLIVSGSPRPASPGPPPIPADATLVAQTALVVGDRDITDVVVPLVPGPRVSGRVEFEGTIDKTSTQSLTNLRITLDPADGSAPDDATLAMQTGRPDESGQFKTYGVPPGRYVIRVSLLPTGWFLKGAIYQGRDVADLPLDLASKDAAGVVITLTDRPSTLSGVVRGPDGPDPSAIVLVYPVDRAAWSSSGALSRRMRTARASKDGAYSLQALPAGEYYLAAVQEDMVADWQDPSLLQALSRVARTIRLVDGEQKTENLTAVAVR